MPCSCRDEEEALLREIAVIVDRLGWIAQSTRQGHHHAWTVPGANTHDAGRYNQLLARLRDLRHPEWPESWRRPPHGSAGWGYCGTHQQECGPVPEYPRSGGER